MRKPLTVFFIGLIALTALNGCHFFWKRYYDKDNQFSIVVPRWWTLDTKRPPSALIILAPLRDKNDIFRANLTVTVADLDNEDQVEVFWEQNKKMALAGLPGYKSHVEEGDFYAGMEHGQYLTFTLRTDLMNIKIKTVVWFRGLRVYTSTCSAETDKFRKYAGIFDKMLSSISMTYHPPAVKKQ